MKTRKSKPRHKSKSPLSNFKGWLSKPFPKKTSFWKLAKYWFLIFIAGIALRALVLFVYPASGQAEEVVLSTFCNPIDLATAVLAPLTENLIFMILPFMWKKQKGLIVGLAFWVFLHYLDRDLPSFLQNLALAVFYYKAVSAKKYKETVLFHGIINWTAALSCL